MAVSETLGEDQGARSAAGGGHMAMTTALTSMFIIFLPFQDTPLANTALRAFGYSLSVVPLVVLMFLSLVQWFANPDRRVSGATALITLYVLIVSLASLIIFGSFSNGSNLIVKSMTMTILYVSFLYAIFGIDWDADRYGRLIQYAFLTFVLIVFFTQILGVKALDGFPIHGRINAQMRPRGPAYEASTAGAFLISMSCLSAFLSKRRLVQLAFVIAAALCLLLVKSKGGFIMFLATLTVALTLGRGISWRNIIIGLVVGVAVSAVALPYIFSQAIREMVGSQSTSVISRGTLWLLPFHVALSNPFGVGPTGYYPAVSYYGPQITNWLESLTGLPALFFAEVRGYFFATNTEAIDTKTYMGNLIMMGGFPGLFLWLGGNVWLLARLVRISHPNRLFLIAAVAYVFMAGSTYVSSMSLYNLAAVYGIAFATIRQAARPPVLGPDVAVG